MNCYDLVDEIKDCLALNGKTPEDVHYVGSEDRVFTWDTFELVASSLVIELGLNEELKVLGKEGWWLEINTWADRDYRIWEFRTPPFQEELTVLEEPEHVLDTVLLHMEYTIECGDFSYGGLQFTHGMSELEIRDKIIRRPFEEMPVQWNAGTYFRHYMFDDISLDKSVPHKEFFIPEKLCELLEEGKL